MDLFITGVKDLFKATAGLVGLMLLAWLGWSVWGSFQEREELLQASGDASEVSLVVGTQLQLAEDPQWLNLDGLAIPDCVLAEYASWLNQRVTGETVVHTAVTDPQAQYLWIGDSSVQIEAVAAGMALPTGNPFATSNQRDEHQLWNEAMDEAEGLAQSGKVGGWATGCFVSSS